MDLVRRHRLTVQVEHEMRPARIRLVAAARVHVADVLGVRLQARELDPDLAPGVADRHLGRAGDLVAPLRGVRYRLERAAHGLGGGGVGSRRGGAAVTGVIAAGGEAEGQRQQADRNRQSLRHLGLLSGDRVVRPDRDRGRCRPGNDDATRRAGPCRSCDQPIGGARPERLAAIRSPPRGPKQRTGSAAAAARAGPRPAAQGAREVGEQAFTGEAADQQVGEQQQGGRDGEPEARLADGDQREHRRAGREEREPGVPAESGHCPEETSGPAAPPR